MKGMIIALCVMIQTLPEHIFFLNFEHSKQSQNKEFFVEKSAGGAVCGILER